MTNHRRVLQSIISHNNVVLRQTTCECVYFQSYRWQRRQSQHSLRHRRNPHSHANFTARSSVEPELLLIQVDIARIGNIASLLLQTWPSRWPDDLYIRLTWRLKISMQITNKLSTSSKLSKLIASHTDGHTDRCHAPASRVIMIY